MFRGHTTAAAAGVQVSTRSVLLACMQLLHPVAETNIAGACCYCNAAVVNCDRSVIGRLLNVVLQTHGPIFVL